MTVENYGEFTKMAKRLNQIGYGIEEVPSQEQFDTAMQEYYDMSIEDDQEGIFPTIPDMSATSGR